MYMYVYVSMTRTMTRTRMGTRTKKITTIMATAISEYIVNLTNFLFLVATSFNRHIYILWVLTRQTTAWVILNIIDFTGNSQ